MDGQMSRGVRKGGMGMERLMDGRKGGLEWIVRGMDGWMDRWKGGKEGREECNRFWFSMCC